MELAADSGAAESLWIRIKGKKSNVGVTVGVYYRLPSQDKDANKLVYEELKDTSKPTALVLMGDFNLPEIKSEHHSADTTQARRF